MRLHKKGFTLIEMVVVVLIMGILATISIPYYYKTVESTRATDAVAIGHLLSSAYRMFQIDNPGVSLNGAVTSSCNSGACTIGSLDACRLVRCNYVVRQDWSNSSYSYAVGGACGGNASCVRRVGGRAPYSSWGYDFNMGGGCTALGGAPPCPTF